MTQCRNLTPEATARGRQRTAQAQARAAEEAYADLRPLLADLRTAGKSFQAMADELNSQGHTTRRSKPWKPVPVARVRERVRG